MIVGRSLQPDRRPGRPGGRLVRRRRLHQVHAHDRVRGHAAARGTQRALGAGAPASARARDPLRARLAAARRGTSGAESCTSRSGIGSGNQDGHVQRRPRPLAAAARRTTSYGRGRTATCATDRRSAPTRRATPVPPNLAGRRRRRVRARGAGRRARRSPARARAELAHGRGDLRRREDTGMFDADDVVTALPHAFYPESSWRDDLELGAAELALAGQALRRPARGRLAARPPRAGPRPT